MNTLKAIVVISRPLNFLITLVAVLVAGLIAAPLEFLDSNIIIAAISMSLAFSGGNIINDIYDIEIDTINRPDRILPRKILSVNFAWLLYLIFTFISLTSALICGTASLLFVIAVTLILYLYSYSLKKITLVSNLIVAIITSSALLYGAFIAGNITAGIIPAVFAFFTNLIREIIKDIEDVEGDAANDVITFPKSYGINKSITLIKSLTVTLILLTTVPFLLKIYKIEYFILVMPVVNGLFVYMLRSISEDRSLRNLHKMSSLVKLNMLLGIIAIYIGNI